MSLAERRRAFRSHRMKSLAPLLFLLVLCLPACASGSGTPWVELKGKRYFVEVADDDAERERGLMFRDSMPADRGMLFVHEREEPQAYWMKNTKIPLDILYFDSKRRLVSAQKRVPPCSAGDRCPPFPSEGNVLYVLELNAGAADAMGLAKGDELTFSADIAPAKP
jgi:uncharacterized membrane protein (UPF0127 family)